MARQQYRGPWPKLRLAVLNRDGWQCQIRGPKCVGRATTVDHIDDVATHGPTWNPDRLRAACVPCNCGRGGQLGAERRRANPLPW